MAKRVNRHNHIRSLFGGSRRAIEALFEGFKTKSAKQQIIYPESKISFSKLIKAIPKKAIFRHELVTLDVTIERPERTVIGIDINNVTFKFTRVQNIKCVSKSIRRSSVSTSSIGHQDLHGTNIVSTGCSAEKKSRNIVSAAKATSGKLHR